MSAATDGGRVVVIGAGLAGLSAAARLLAHGRHVTVVEAGTAPGGLVRSEDLPDGTGGTIRFDTGATVLTMPGLIDDTLADIGVSAAESRRRLDLIDVDPAYAMRFADGSALDVPRGADRLVHAVRDGFGAADATGVDNLMSWLSRLYDTEFTTFIDRNFTGVGDALDPATVRAVGTLARMGAIRRLTGAINRFVKDERLQRIFTFQALYAGLPPAQAAAVYGVIAHMDIGLGVYYPRAGMGRVGAVLAEALTDAGAEVRTGTRVTELIREGRDVAGVRVTSGEIIPADAVISTLPVPRTAELLGAPPRGVRWRGIRYSPSAVVVHGTLPRSVTAAWPGRHHTLDFGAAWRDTFVDLTRSPGSPMRDPSFLMTRPALTVPDAYREGPEPVSVLAPCPNTDVAALDWTTLSEPYVAEILQTLAARGYPGIESIRVLRVDHPDTWAADGLPAGTPFSAAHTLRQTGPLRTPNRWPGQRNLFLAGAVTVPGVGIPPVLVSGRLAAERVDALLSGTGGRHRSRR